VNFISEIKVLLDNLSDLKPLISFLMKTLIYSAFFLFIIMLSSCNGNKENAMSSAKPIVKVTKAEVTRVVKDYFKQKFKNPIISENEGLVRIQGDLELSIFRQDKIFIGKLDNDETLDAVVTYGYQKTGSMAYDRHLILLNTDSLRIVKDFPAVMKIQEIASKRVIAVIDTAPKQLNAAPCPSCQFLVQLKLQGDSLVREK
jgi:hypothetical protein